MFQSLKTGLFGKLRLFAQSESGMTLPLLALSLVALTGFTGIAVDMGRVQMVQSKLQFSVDAAGLAAGATVSTANADSEFMKYLNVDFGCTSGSSDATCYMGSKLTGHSVVVDSTNTAFTLSATATMPTTFMSIVGVKTVTLTANSQISRAITGLELALVLDNTGSMADFAGGSVSKLQALQSASKTLIDTLFGGVTTSTNGKLWVGIVPFSQTVNIGTSHIDDWINKNYTYDGTTQIYANLNWGNNGSAWGGCVDARQGGKDITDDPPVLSSPSTLFGQYYWTSDNLNTDAFSINGGNEWWLYHECQEKYCRRKDGGSCSYVYGSCVVNYNHTCTDMYTEKCSDVTSCTGVYNSCTLTTFVSPLDTTHNGPNLYCPQQITTMTNTSTTLKTAIDAMSAQGNTEINQGLAWGWNMLSPRWRTYWGGTMDSNGLPLDYNSKGMVKAVVLLTDGENTMDSGGSYGGYTINSNHGSYWYTSSGRTGSTSSSGAVTKLDDKTLALCTAMKNAGIYIYTIGLGPSSGINTTLLQNCATAVNYYFASPSTADLQKVFNTIGDLLSNLRVSQ